MVNKAEGLNAEGLNVENMTTDEKVELLAKVVQDLFIKVNGGA
ncbi:hypothetical protein [Priestia megaterium]|nr:hypothetical protein [Priestia megaterium]MDR7246313.1 hypothetical protein [Priestia megaterium]